jgi:ribosome-associated translation inhibitor RaiA
MLDDLELITFSELLDKLTVINIKLFNLLEKAAELDRKENRTAEDIETIIRLSGENIRLVKQRSNLKSAIDKKLNQAIRKGGTEILDEVKNYNR